MPDVVIPTGGMPVPAEDLSSADQDTVTGDGTARNPLVSTGGGGGGLTVAVAKTASFAAAIGNLYPVGGSGGVATLPAAATAGNGAIIGIAPSGASGAWSFAPTGGDDCPNTTVQDDGDYLEVISNGVDKWYSRSLIDVSP